MRRMALLFTLVLLCLVLLVGCQGGQNTATPSPSPTPAIQIPGHQDFIKQ